MTAQDIYTRETGKEPTYQLKPIDHPDEREYSQDYIWWLEQKVELYCQD